MRASMTAGSRDIGPPTRWQQHRHPQNPKIKAWLARRPHYHVHFTPTSASWINQVERWFAELTRKRLSAVFIPPSGNSKPIFELSSIGHNQNPRPFKWTKSADQILASVKALLPQSAADIMQRTLDSRDSVPIPKFASLCGTLVCELRNRRDTSNLIDSSAVLDLKFATQTRGYNDRNFKSTALGRELIKVEATASREGPRACDVGKAPIADAIAAVRKWSACARSRPRGKDQGQRREGVGRFLLASPRAFRFKYPQPRLRCALRPRHAEKAS